MNASGVVLTLPVSWESPVLNKMGVLPAKNARFVP